MGDFVVLPFVVTTILRGKMKQNMMLRKLYPLIEYLNSASVRKLLNRHRAVEIAMVKSWLQWWWLEWPQQ